MNQSTYIVDGITKKFGAIKVLDSVSFEIRSGTVVVCIGANGAGKTTCFKTLCGLLRPDSGGFFRKDAASAVQMPVHRTSIGYCPQEISIWPDLTCREQLIAVARFNGLDSTRSRNRAGEVLRALDLSSKADVLAMRLSGGMKRRLNLGLALVHEPPLCILDEPLDGVDLPGRACIREYLRTVAARKEQTILISTHLIEEAMLMEGSVVLFKDRKAVVYDSPEALSRSAGGVPLENLLIGSSTFR